MTRNALTAVVRNSALNLTGQGLYALLQLCSIVVLSRALGTAAFGRYYTIFAIILIVQLISEGGLTTILTRRLVRAPDDRHRTIDEGATLFGAVSVVSLIVMMLLGVGAVRWWQETSLLGAFTAAGVACAAIQIQRFCAGILQACERFAYENIARVVQGGTFAVAVLLLVAPGITTSLTEVVTMLAASHLCAAALLMAVVRQQHGIVRPARRCAWKSWLLEAGPLGFGDVIRSLTWQLDTLLLGLLQPAAVVGIYSVAYRPLGPLNYVPRAILSAQFPQFTRLASDPPALQQAAMRSARVLTLVSVPIAVAVFVFAEPLVVLIGGPEYLEAARPLRLLIWISVLSFVTMHFRYVLAAVAKERAYAVLVTAVFVVELVVELALIPSQGYMGACAGSLAGESLFVAAGYFVCRRQLRGASSRVLQPAARPA